MLCALQWIRRRLSDERGFTFPELIVATMMGMLAIAGAMMILQIAVRAQPQALERSGQIQQARALIETVSRELRQGASIQGASTTGLTIDTYVNRNTCGGTGTGPSILCRVTYACTAASCTRTESSVSGGAGRTTELARGLLAPSIFSYCIEQAGAPSCGLSAATNPSYVGIRLAYSNPDGGESVTFDDGVALRNHTSEAPL